MMMMCRSESMPRSQLLLLGLLEQLAHVLLGLADKLVQHLGARHDLGLAAVEHLADLARNQRLAGAGRAVEQQAAHVLGAELLHHGRRVDARGERAAERSS
jgi:hypothetical protein